MAPRKQTGKATKAEAVKGPPKGFPAFPAEQLGGVVKYSEPLGRHTTFRIGGPAAIHFQPATAEAAAGAVAWAKQHKVPWLVLGLGSNVLIRDGGFPGLVVKIAKGLDAVSHRAGTWKLPDDLDYAALPGLSNEARQKLQANCPRTIGHASRIDGITPAALTLLVAHVKRSRAAAKRA